MKFQKILFLIVLFFFVSIDGQAQCAMCRAVLETDNGSGPADGINNGIVYLMAFPYLLMGTIGYFIYRSRQKAKQNRS